MLKNGRTLSLLLSLQGAALLFGASLFGTERVGARNCAARRTLCRAARGVQLSAGPAESECSRHHSAASG